MCGIGGSTRSDAALLAGFCRIQRYRGPDDEGTWLEANGGMGLAHTRLAVIDLSPGGHQPMVSSCGRYVLAYNGEIFNYRELRAELEAKGEAFASESDTEVLLALLRREGATCLSRLVGMFAIAFWDREAEELLLARDHLGIKPLVYAPLADGHLAFASVIEALVDVPGVDLSRDQAALSQYLACLYVPEPRTMYTGIRKLAPGHVLRWRRGQGVLGDPQAFWQPCYTGERNLSVADAVEEITPLVRSAVTNAMVSDVSIGCFLSGGIDSSVIAALMAEGACAQGADPIRTFTMTFDNPAYDEREQAARVAAHIGSRHTEIAASPDLVRLLDDSLHCFGEPFGNPTSLLINDLSRKAREHVTVALVGDGGDEVFAGYPRYQGGRWAETYRRWVPGWVRSGMVAPLAGLIREDVSGRHGLRRARQFLKEAAQPADRTYGAWVEYFSPVERDRLLGLDAGTSKSPIAALYAEAPSPDPLDAMQQTDLLSFLPGNLLAYGDAMSMAHALELRLPLLDHRLVDTVGRIAPSVRFADGKKTLLRKVAERLLPDDIVNAPKRGFNPPMGQWLKADLGVMIDERLTPERLTDLGFDPDPVRGLVADHRSGRRDNGLKIWSLLVLDAWDRGREKARANA